MSQIKLTKTMKIPPRSYEGNRIFFGINKYIYIYLSCTKGAYNNTTKNKNNSIKQTEATVLEDKREQIPNVIQID